MDKRRNYRSCEIGGTRREGEKSTSKTFLTQWGELVEEKEKSVARVHSYDRGEHLAKGGGRGDKTWVKDYAIPTKLKTQLRRKEICAELRT